MSGKIVAIAVLAAALAGTAAAASSGGTITYRASPSTRFAFASGTTALPSPSQCVALLGQACYTPAEIRAGYQVPASATGAGQTIVIVEAFGSPTIQQDLAAFDAAFGLPDPVLNVVYPGGKPTFHPQQADNQQFAAETSLDVEWAHAIAPAATIDLVVAANNNGDTMANAQQYAVSHHLGSVMSLSFGVPEASIGGNNDQQAQAHAAYVAAKAAGITVLAASGDTGGNNLLGVLNANYPASDPLVTSVGGTNLFLGDDGSYQSEDVWNDSDPALCPFGCTQGIFGATGGAPSLLFPGRRVADVGYNASLYTAVLVFMSWPGVRPGFYLFGGTSEGAPQWAGIVADANQAAGHALGYLNPKLDAIGADPAQYAADFHDVTVGQNGFFGPGTSAGPGYDMPTGWGTPIVANLIGDLAH